MSDKDTHLDSVSCSVVQYRLPTPLTFYSEIKSVNFNIQEISNFLRIWQCVSIKQENCIFIAKYPYHFLTVAICWSHPTQWPTQRCDFKVM